MKLNMPKIQISHNVKIEDSLSISEAAFAMKVSEATIRNWIKTEYLSLNSDNCISHSSLDRFRSEILGVEKLTGRANKSHLDIHNHSDLVLRIEEMINSHLHHGDHMSKSYEDSLSDSYKNQEGIYYTPLDVCDEFFENVPENISQLTFLDPCCGTGNFLLAAIKAGFSPQNVYGFDVDNAALSIARERIKEATGYDSTCLFQADFINLPDTVKKLVPAIDVIFTNPPWGKKFDKKEKEAICQKYSCPKSLDSSGIFTLECRNFISENGIYGMLLPESFFNVAAFEFVRRKLFEDKIVCISDHGKVFVGLITKAVSFVARREIAPPRNNIKFQNSTGIDHRDQNSFSRNPRGIINYNASDSDAEVIDYIFSLPHLKLAGRAQWALGVVTGNNKLHIRDTPEDGFVPIYKGSDIGVNSLKQPSNWVSADMSKFQQVAPEKMYKCPNKIIYKFISSKIVCCHDNTGSFILNSANLFIPNDDFPINPRLLSEYLSSKFVNWIFEKLFYTHKILRSDLEEIPIFSQFIVNSSSFDEDKLLESISIGKDKNGSYRVKK